jgi:cardiolipin synthase
LAIEVNDAEVIERLKKIAHHDWQHSHPMDLSNEGLLEDLEEHKIDAGETLALDEENRKHKKE